MENLNVRKFFLYLLVCSIALSAIMGIWAIISGEFGELQGKILGTTMTVVGTSILGLACGAFLESLRSQNNALRIVPGIEVVAAVENYASQKTAEKSGAVREGVLLQLISIGDVFHDAVVFSFIRADFEDNS